MNKKLFRKWLAALRSPDQTQCFATMKEGDARCAIGVLNDIASSEPMPALKHSGVVTALWLEITRLNDVMRLPLPAIADWIENHADQFQVVP